VIDKKNLMSLCDFAEFLDGLDSEYSTIVVYVQVNGTLYKLTGTMKSVPPSIITLGP